MTTPMFRILALTGTLLLTACAAQQLPGFQQVYYSYEIPQPLLEKIASKFRQHGLAGAKIERDSVGRVRLAGLFQNEDEVDQAFIIAQSIVGIKSTSPFYPTNIKAKRWEKEAAEAMNRFFKEREARKLETAEAPKKLALIIGINDFRDNTHLKSIQGQDDAEVVRDRLLKANYRVNTLLGSAATKANIEASIKKIENEVRPQDTLFIYVSSHGNAPVPSHYGQDQRKMSIVAYDSGDTAPGQRTDKTDYMLNLQKTSVADTLVQKLAQKPTKVTRVFIDTCYSGEMLNDVKDDSYNHIVRLNGGKTEKEGISMAAWSSPAYFSSKAITFVEAGNTAGPVPGKSMAATAGKDASRAQIDRNRPGYTIITATSEGQESLGPSTDTRVFASPVSSSKMLRGSFFTQAFFDYLDVSSGEIAPAFENARKFTEQKAADVSKGTRQQVPRQYSTFSSNPNNLYL